MKLTQYLFDLAAGLTATAAVAGIPSWSDGQTGEPPVKPKITQVVSDAIAKQAAALTEEEKLKVREMLESAIGRHYDKPAEGWEKNKGFDKLLAAAVKNVESGLANQYDEVSKTAVRYAGLGVDGSKLTEDEARKLAQKTGLEAQRLLKQKTLTEVGVLRSDFPAPEKGKDLDGYFTGLTKALELERVLRREEFNRIGEVQYRLEAAQKSGDLAGQAQAIVDQGDIADGFSKIRGFAKSYRLVGEGFTADKALQLLSKGKEK
jgi:hypothetical protein